MDENKLKDLMEYKSGNVRAFAKEIDIPYTTVRSILERGVLNAKTENVFKICAALNIRPEAFSDLLPPIESSPSVPSLASPKLTDELTEQILETVGDLSPNGKKSVLSYASDLLEREQDEATLAEPELFKIYYTSAAKAGPKGFGYDDYESDHVYTDQEPPRYDIATMVDGQSMAPKYQDGDILYLRDYGASTYNGDECVVVVDDKSYFKKVYSTDTGLLLVSINDDKDTYPDFEIDFPPTDGSHIKIFNVVGSFTPLEG